MAKIIDDETMENVCILAKLSLTEDEKEKAKEDMQKMLDYVDKLDELDTSSVEPMSHIFEDENVFREDIVTNGDNHEAMLAQCTETERKPVSGSENNWIRQETGHGFGKINRITACGKDQAASDKRPGRCEIRI